MGWGGVVVVGVVGWGYEKNCVEKCHYRQKKMICRSKDHALNHIKTCLNLNTMISAKYPNLHPTNIVCCIPGYHLIRYKTLI